MIEKMKFLSITGPREDIDRVVDTYLSRYEIHLENALSELKTVKNLRPYIEANPYKEQLASARNLMERFSGTLPKIPANRGESLPGIKEAASFVVLSVSEGVIEASPAVYDNYAVVGTRDCKIWGIRLQ